MRAGFKSSLYRAGFVYEGVWASIPAASTTKAGDQAWVSDIGSAGSVWVSDGTTRWYPANGVVTLLSTAIPMILPSSGTIGNNGALSGLTALPTTYANAYLYFPANAIAAGVAAGLYYCVMSSTTAGTIYNNTYTSGQPTIPASPTAFSTTGPGAYTQSTFTAITLLSVTVPANTMGVNGQLGIKKYFGNNNTAGSKTEAITFGGSTIFSFVASTSAGLWLHRMVSNMGVAAAQITAPTALLGPQSMGAVPVFTTVNSAVNQTLAITGSIATATDWCGSVNCDVELVSI